MSSPGYSFFPNIEDAIKKFVAAQRVTAEANAQNAQTNRAELYLKLATHTTGETRDQALEAFNKTLGLK